MRGDSREWRRREELTGTMSTEMFMSLENF